ncbi:MAG: hypothetical protein IPK99_06040 [Flavobacteriales bacterium]|nr:hypothetical protein [Flavobacteriales bacterium]
MRPLPFLILLALLAALPEAMHAQDGGIGQKEQERIQERKEKDEKKKLVKQRKNDRKRHLSHQDKATRKRIRQNTKRADRHGSGHHRDPFLKRLFTK